MKKLMMLPFLALSIQVHANDFGDNYFDDNDFDGNPNIQMQFDTVHQVYTDPHSSQNDDWIYQFGTYDLQRALSQRDRYEEWFNANYEGEQSNCADTYHFAYPGQDSDAEEEISYEMYSDWVLAHLTTQNSFVMYQVLSENGAYKINDIRHYIDDEISESFQEQVAQYCNIGEI